MLFFRFPPSHSGAYVSSVAHCWRPTDWRRRKRKKEEIIQIIVRSTSLWHQWATMSQVALQAISNCSFSSQISCDLAERMHFGKVVWVCVCMTTFDYGNMSAVRRWRSTVHFPALYIFQPFIYFSSCWLCANCRSYHFGRFFPQNLLCSGCCAGFDAATT